MLDGSGQSRDDGSDMIDTGSSSLFGRQRQRRPMDYAELRRAVSIRQVLDLLGWAPVSRHGSQLRGPCPIHRSGNERSRSFSVNVEKNVFRCFKPGCSQGNQLDLYALATGLPLLDAAHQLCERIGLAAPPVPTRRTKNDRA